MYYTGAEYLTNDLINKIIATTNQEEKFNMADNYFSIWKKGDIDTRVRNVNLKKGLSLFLNKNLFAEEITIIEYNSAGYHRKGFLWETFESRADAEKYLRNIK